MKEMETLNGRKRKTNEMDIPIESKRQFKSNISDRHTTTKKQSLSDSFQPRGINVLEYAEARALEIKNLKSVLNQAKREQNSSAVQQLPRHMRRRAGNHDIKRIPKRIRPYSNINVNKTATKEKKPKKKNRKQRRKPKSLFEEYKKRQEGYKWLETHIWHAKRFYMKQRWNYKVADRTFAKAIRSSYRSVKNSCMIQDISYYEVLEVIGSQENILEWLKKLAPDTDATDFQYCENYLNIMCYRTTCYPYEAIGPVKILWGSIDEGLSKQRKLMVLLHPSISDSILEEIKQYHGEEDTRKLTVESHKLDFVMFRLSGKQSAAMLANVLEADSDYTENNMNWKKRILQSKSTSIINLCVKDPRFNIPQKKKNPLEEIDQEPTEKVPGTIKQGPETTKIIHYSDVWDNAKRQLCSESKISDVEVNKMKETFLCKVDSLPNKSPSIPVCLLHVPPSSNGGTNFDQGYQVVLPSNWGMPFWIALIYQGAKAGGLQEDENIYFESNSFCFPSMYPDTKAGNEIISSVAKEKLEKYQRIPPAKRISYCPLGIRFPHSFPWLDLNREWRFNLDQLLQTNHGFQKGINDKFYVLRQPVILKKLSAVLSGSLSCFGLEDISKYENALVPVKIQSLHHGIPEDNALLCIPTQDDHLNLQESKVDEFSEYQGPSESQHKGLKEAFPFVYKTHGLAYHNVQLIGKSTRWIVGFVLKGNYSFLAGKGRGICFVSFLGLYYHLQTMKNEHPNNLLLFRNTNTLHYRFCELDIIF